jgi:hypothetical protein
VHNEYHLGGETPNPTPNPTILEEKTSERLRYSKLQIDEAKSDSNLIHYQLVEGLHCNLEVKQDL